MQKRVTKRVEKMISAYALGGASAEKIAVCLSLQLGVVKNVLRRLDRREDMARAAGEDPESSAVVFDVIRNPYHGVRYEDYKGPILESNVMPSRLSNVSIPSSLGG